MRALKTVMQHFSNYKLKSGVFHFYRGEHGPAAEYLTRVLTEEEDVSAADRRAALYYLVQARIGAAAEFEAAAELERAIEEYRLALDVMPTYPDVQFKLGQALLAMGRHEDAIEHFSLALKGNPLYVEVLVELGFTLIDLGRMDEAQAFLRKALTARTETLRRKVSSAEAALEGANVRTAREMYQDAFRADIDAFQRAFKRGLDLLRAEKWEDAATDLALAAELCPRFADVHNYLGVSLAESGRNEESIEAFRRSVEINSAYVAAWLNLAYTAEGLGDQVLAREALEPVLIREPDNGPAQHLAERLRSGAAASGRRPRAVQEDS